MAHTIYDPLAKQVITVIAQLDALPEPQSIRVGGTPDGKVFALVEVVYPNPEEATVVHHALERRGLDVSIEHRVVTVHLGAKSK